MTGPPVSVELELSVQRDAAWVVVASDDDWLRKGRFQGALAFSQGMSPRIA